MLQLRLKAEHVSQELKVADESEVVVKKGAKKTRLVVLADFYNLRYSNN